MVVEMMTTWRSRVVDRWLESRWFLIRPIAYAAGTLWPISLIIDKAIRHGAGLLMPTLYLPLVLLVICLNELGRTRVKNRRLASAQSASPSNSLTEIEERERAGKELGVELGKLSALMTEFLTLETSKPTDPNKTPNAIAYAIGMQFTSRFVVPLNAITETIKSRHLLSDAEQSWIDDFLQYGRNGNVKSFEMLADGLKYKARDLGWKDD